MKFSSKYIPETEVKVVRGQYLDRTTMLQLFDAETGEAVTRATVCLAAYGLRPEAGNVFVYGDYSEHEGVLHGLQQAGIVGEIVRTISIGGHDAEAFEVVLLLDNELETR